MAWFEWSHSEFFISQLTFILVQDVYIQAFDAW
jgi:hypothetical protein